MLLNHKEAIDFIVEDPGYLEPMTLSGIEDIHSWLQDNEITTTIGDRVLALGYTQNVPTVEVKYALNPPQTQSIYR